MDGGHCFRLYPDPDNILSRYRGSKDVGLAKDMCLVKSDCIGIEFDAEGYFNLCYKATYTHTGWEKYNNVNSFLLQKATEIGK